MDTEIIKSLIDLGGTVTVVFAFLWYLRDRNGRQEKALSEISKSLQKNTMILIKVAQKHKLIKEIDELIQ